MTEEGRRQAKLEPDEKPPPGSEPPVSEEATNHEASEQDTSEESVEEEQRTGDAPGDDRQGKADEVSNADDA